MCRIIRYDRAGRYGKLQVNAPSTEFGEQEFFFRLAAATANRSFSDVIDAMHLGYVRCSLTAYRDSTRKIERLVLHDIDLE